MADRRSAHRAEGRQSVGEWYAGRQVPRSLSSPASARGMQTPPHSHRSFSSQRSNSRQTPRSQHSSSQEVRSPPQSYRSRSVEGVRTPPRSSRSQSAFTPPQSHCTNQVPQLCDRPKSKESSPRPSLLSAQSRSFGPLRPLPAHASGIKPLCFEAWTEAEEVCFHAPVKQPVACKALHNPDVQVNALSHQPSARSRWLLCLAVAAGLAILVAAGVAVGVFFLDGQAAPPTGRLFPASMPVPALDESQPTSSVAAESNEKVSTVQAPAPAPAPVSIPAVQVQGALILMANDAGSFVQDPRSKRAIRSCVAKKLRGIDASMVEVKSLRLSRRLSTLRGRRLLLERIDVDYAIVLDGNALTTPVSVADTLQRLTPREVTQDLSGALEALGMEQELEVTMLSAEVSRVSDTSAVRVTSTEAASPMPVSTTARTTPRAPSLTIVAAFAAPEMTATTAAPQRPTPAIPSASGKPERKPRDGKAEGKPDEGKPEGRPDEGKPDEGKPEGQPHRDKPVLEGKPEGKPHGSKPERKPEDEHDHRDHEGKDCDKDKKHPEAKEGSGRPEGSADLQSAKLGRPAPMLEETESRPEQKGAHSGKGGKGR
eukprot:TRINITY_DN6079_c0_g1_i2.p1 TRINITY_DN6079_c0_g1~~TRINITY_DN6079_c0_g1_i2.p1  ORF type:complete len:620 (-),score=119.22 TRINITY_DN6079_c0_g1_i2:89-1879(-)